MTPETWTTGDLALCVESGFERVLPTDRDPGKGSIHTVKRVVHRDGRVGLVFAEFRYAYLAACFRRIAPFTEDELRQELVEMHGRQPTKADIINAALANIGRRK